jgi:molybdopterin adenylyltransferase
MKDLRFAVITVSDRSSRGERPDTSGPALVDMIKSRGGNVTHQVIIPDDHDLIMQELKLLSDTNRCDIILTTGGTGVSPRDVTPEATRDISDKIIPGIGEYIRMRSLQITPHAMLSRGIAAIRNKTIIINLPGSPKGATESLEFVASVLGHAVAQIQNLPTAQDHNPSGAI